MPAVALPTLLLVAAVCLTLPLVVQAVRRRDRRRMLLGATVLCFAGAGLLAAVGVPAGSPPVVALDAAAWLALVGVVGEWAWRRWGGGAA
jgi:peptidoglycan/LPS O-acetylase OafA/YrhL